MNKSKNLIPKQSSFSSRACRKETRQGDRQRDKEEAKFFLGFDSNENSRHGTLFLF